VQGKKRGAAVAGGRGSAAKRGERTAREKKREGSGEQAKASDASAAIAEGRPRVGRASSACVLIADCLSTKSAADDEQPQALRA
jgi:hypothetical protein